MTTRKKTMSRKAVLARAAHARDVKLARLAEKAGASGVVEIPLPAVLPAKSVPAPRRAPTRSDVQRDLDVLGGLIAATFLALKERSK